ncbi:MAG: hypothetical protein ACO3A4_08605 [Silvanigrellaceae bacterium]
MKALLLRSLLASTVLSTACGQHDNGVQSQIASQSTLTWNFTSASAPVSTMAESGACAGNLPSTMIVNNYCFNEVPVANVTTSLASSELVTLCVATSTAGSVNNAALLVVDAAGQNVAESMGKGDFQIVATLAGSGKFRVYVGFPTAAAGQRVKVLAGLTGQFGIASSACSLR